MCGVRKFGYFKDCGKYEIGFSKLVSSVCCSTKTICDSNHWTHLLDNTVMATKAFLTWRKLIDGVQRRTDGDQVKRVRGVRVDRQTHARAVVLCGYSNDRYHTSYRTIAENNNVERNYKLQVYFSFKINITIITSSLLYAIVFLYTFVTPGL